MATRRRNKTKDESVRLLISLVQKPYATKGRQTELSSRIIHECVRCHQSRVLLANERSERDTIRGVQIRAGAVYVYIY